MVIFPANNLIACRAAVSDVDTPDGFHTDQRIALEDVPGSLVGIANLVGEAGDGDLIPGSPGLETLLQVRDDWLIIHRSSCLCSIIGMYTYHYIQKNIFVNILVPILDH